MGRVIGAFLGDEPALRGFVGTRAIDFGGPTVFNFLSGELDNRLTLTRASEATYFDASGVLQTAAVNTPRFGYWYNAAADAWQIGGLLLDSQERTNRCLQNRTQTNASWTKTNVTATKNVTGLDGVGNSACRLTATAGNGTCLQAITSASATRTFSAYLKRISGTGKVDITLDGGTLWIDVTRFISSARWTRVCQTVEGGTNPTVGFRIRTSGDVVAVDFCQEETGSGPSSPIATTAAEVTRSPDVIACHNPHFTWYSQDEGTLILSWLHPEWQRGTCGLIQFDDGTDDNRHYFNTGEFENGRELSLYSVVGGVQDSFQTLRMPYWNRVRSAAYRYKTDEFLLTVDGTTGPNATIAAAGTAPTVSRMKLGFGEFSGFVRRVEHRRVTYTNSETAALVSRSATTADLGTFALGVNLSGLEFGSTMPGTVGVDYFRPDSTDINYFGAGKGFDHFRLPFRWERIQPTLGAALNATYLGYIHTIVDDAAAVGMTVILDMHNFGAYTSGGVSRRIDAVGGPTTADFADVWERIATEFAGDPGILGYDIMNEPRSVNSLSAEWYVTAQAAVTAIRGVDTTSTIFLEGHGNASGSAQWLNSNTTNSGDIDLHVIDPQDNLVYSAHSYWDTAGSGVYANSYDTDDVTEDRGWIRLQPFLAWCAVRGRQAHLGEGNAPGRVADDDRWLDVLQGVMTELEAHSVLTTPWGGGEFWSNNYVLKLSPISGVDPQSFTDVYSQYVSGDVTPPSKVMNLQAVSTGPQSIHLSWDAATDNVLLVSYQVRRGGTLIATVLAPTLTYDNTGLNPNTLYSYTVTAVDAAGNAGTASDADTATTDQDVTAPTAPSGLTAQAVSSAQINLAWGASTDDVAVATYHIKRDGVEVASVPVGTLTYDDTGLNDGTTYTYRVTAKDTSDNESAQSNEASDTTTSLNTAASFVFTSALDARVTLTRASTGTYFDASGVLQTAAINTPRFGYYFDGTSWVLGGLVIDGVSRANRCLHNRDLTNAAWTKTNGTALKNVTGLDGVSNSASRFTATGSNATCLQSITSGSTQRTFSVYLKRLAGTGAIDITLDNGTTWYKITRFVDGTNWTRVYHNMTVANPTVGIRLRTSGDAVAVDFAQEESGGGPSSPIATTTASVTRSPDVVSVTGTNFSDWYNQNQGSFWVEWVVPAWCRAQNPLISVNDGTTQNRHFLCAGEFSNGREINITTRVSNVTQANISCGCMIPNHIRRAAFAYDTNNYAMACDGFTAEPADTAASVPTSLTRMDIGAGQFSGFMRQIDYYDGPLGFADLRLITDPADLPAAFSLGGFSLGVNVSGLEFGTVFPGTANVDYFRPDATDATYFAGKGYTTVRLPIKWERIQTTYSGTLNAAYVGYITDFLDAADAQGIQVIIDLHNYGGYSVSGTVKRIGDTGGGGPSQADYADVWERIATEFSGHPALLGYDLMNEPNLQSFGDSLTMYSHYQAAINAIRSVDTAATIFISGYGNASGTAQWITSNTGNNPDIDVYLDDPQDLLVFQAHSYWDNDFSGVYNSSFTGEGAYATIGWRRLQCFLGWCIARKAKGLIGEFAAPGLPTSDVRWLEVEDLALAEMQRFKTLATAWGGGEFWSNSYFGKLSPLSGVTEVPMVTDVHEDYL